MAKILCVANQKGGCGKTTTALNLGYGLADLGRRVLLIDLDPQASLTSATLGDCSGRSMADVLGGNRPGDMTISQITQQLRPGLDIAPADISLSNTELAISSRLGREWLLKRSLANLTGYDLVILDSPPSFGLLVVNGLAAADAVITPTLPSALDLRGLNLFLQSLAEIRAELNPSLQLLGVVVVAYDARLRLHQEAMEDLQAGGLPILATISKSVAAARSAGEGNPIPEGSKLHEQYKQLSEEINNQWLN